jgi:uncharacterized SAM-binding protein YcdF (DUF218 family)
VIVVSTSPQRRAPRDWFLSSLVVLGIALSVALAIGWKPVLSNLGDDLVTSPAPQPADLILVLGGDFWGPRVLRAADLGAQGYAPLVLISGPPYRDRPEGEFAIDFLAARGYPRRLFQSFGHHARSTIEEAIILRPELTRRGVRRVLLVTSAYHSRRAAIVFWLFCPGIKFITIPAPDEHYHAYEWWQDPSSRKLFFSEWRKILGTIFVEYPKDRFERLIGASG